ncbi:hypothetical protein [Pseudomonas sp. PS02303]|uniref:hypothetical protein n=1 Tax=Pseudomonas sp. PS02303 TaxID=2991429 RepID=UPI00249A720D|nr:hypothetical protein [Pseudomonas sp. PS02303]
MENLNGWQRLWAVVSVLAGLYTMVYLSDGYMHPTDNVKALYDSEIARLEETLKQVSTGSGSEQAVKQAEDAIAASKTSYVKLIQDIPKVAIWSFVVAAIASLAAGVGVFLAGMAVGWVYRGFRPLPLNPTVEAPQVAAHTPEAAQAIQRPALPNPHNNKP